MLLRVDLVGSHGRWKRPCLEQLKDALTLNKETEQYANTLRHQLSSAQPPPPVPTIPTPPYYATTGVPPSADAFYELQRRHEALKQTVHRQAMQVGRRQLRSLHRASGGS
jgi:hypothetical protein